MTQCHFTLCLTVCCDLVLCMPNTWERSLTLCTPRLGGSSPWVFDKKLKFYLCYSGSGSHVPSQSSLLVIPLSHTHANVQKFYHNQSNNDAVVAYWLAYSPSSFYILIQANILIFSEVSYHALHKSITWNAVGLSHNLPH